MCLWLLKQRTIFFIGIGIGFTFTLLFSSVEDLFNTISICKDQLWENQYHSSINVLPFTISTVNQVNKNFRFQNEIKTKWAQKSETIKYTKWLAIQNVQVNEIDMDEYLYKPRMANNSEEIILLESTWLKSKVLITCIIFVEKVKLAEAIKYTWGNRCNQIYFFSQHITESKIPIINMSIKFKSSWHFLCEVMNYISNNNDIFHWIIFVKEDMIVIPENLRYIVATLDYRKDYYLGHPIVMWGQPFNVAQSGYVLSKGAFKKIIGVFNTSEKCITGGKFWKKEDYYLGKHLSSMGIYPMDTRDKYLKDTFHGYSLQNLLWGVAKPGNYWTHALYPSHGECCSAMSVTFSAGEADKMYTFNYLLYHLHIFTTSGIFGSKHASKPIPEEQVWKIALKEEFNITHLSEISSDAYYEIWHSKYSEPEQFIVKNYHNMPDILNSLLTAYESQNKISDKSLNKIN